MGDPRKDEAERKRKAVYDYFRGSGGNVLSADLKLHYARGRMGTHKPTMSQPGALGAWQAGRDDAKEQTND